MQIKKTSAENIEEPTEISLEMLREVNGLAPDAAFDSDLVAHFREYFLNGDQTTVFAMDGEKIAVAVFLQNMVRKSTVIFFV